MKKFFLVFSLVCLSSMASYGQLVVDEDGRVAIGDNIVLYDEEPVPLLSDFSINSPGLNSACMHLETTNKTYGLHIQASVCNDIVPALLANGSDDRSAPANNKYGIFSQADPASQGNFYGIYGRSYNQMGNYYSRSYGVYGIAGNCTSCFNYGVFGTLHGSYYGAGVYGSSIPDDTGVFMGDYYAGYFRGKVYATGTMTVPSLATLSDYRLKENISSLSQSALDAVEKMNVVQYNYKQREVETANGTEKLYEDDSEILTHKHYGLIAQELREIYPDLVLEDSEGYLSINYIELVPILIQSVQELKAELKAEKQSNALRGQSANTVSSLTDALHTELYQNNPNPFTEKTIIACTIAETIQQAILYVYDMNGKQIAEYPVSERGNAQVIIEGSSLEAGMYMYSLIADGNVIDTKRMILTR